MNEGYLSFSDGQRLADLISQLSERVYRLENEKNALLYAAMAIWQSAEAHDPDLGARMQGTIKAAADNCECYGDAALNEAGDDPRLAAETKDRFYATAAGLRLIAQKEEVPLPDQPLRPFTVIVGGLTDS